MSDAIVMTGWHFSGSDRRLGYGDGRRIEPRQTLTVDVEPRPCKRGLHASRRLLDALRYAPGPYVWRVELSGKVVQEADKAVATERTALWGYDATEVLRDFARRCALNVIDLWNAPSVVVRYLKTGDEALRDAAGDAGWDAARGAAWAAARDAAWAAGWAAARGAAWDAAWAAAEAAAWAEARAEARAAGSAAAGDEAGDAARERQNRRLTAMIDAGRNNAA